jgi:type I restriction enzyme S subunit
LFPVPSIQEQSKIVMLMGKLQQAIEHQEKIIEKTKELKRSLMRRFFTYGLRGEELKETVLGVVPNSWNSKDLEQVADIVYGAQAAVAHAIDSSIGTPIFTNINITNEGQIDLTTLRYYKVPEKKRDRLMLKKGDILFNWRSGSKEHVGKTALFELDGEYTFSSFILRFRASKDIHNRFLVYYLYYLKSIGYFSQYRDQSSVNSVFNASASAKIPVFVPEMDEQKEIAAALNSIDYKIDAEKSRNNSMKALFKTMLNNLMTGQARVKDIDFGEDCE